MISLKRSLENPILSPGSQSWEAEASFNGCAVLENKKTHLIYRAVSVSGSYYKGVNMRVSSIGHAVSDDGIHFQDREQFIKPQHDWEIFGCEDPRITKLDDKYYIFYTALSTYPFSAPGIKIGMATTKDFSAVEGRHLITPFNAKAMALFPERIDGKIVALLTANTDLPPAKIAIAFFDKEEDIWSGDYWSDWYSSLDSHVVPLLRSLNDQVEVGAPPIKTNDGWLLIYSYIRNYYSQTRLFGVEGVLLDLVNPLKVIGRTKEPLLIPEEDYELYGNVPNVVFPGGAVVKDRELLVYYGAADTACCLSSLRLDYLLEEIRPKPSLDNKTESESKKLVRFSQNPIISPIPEFSWEAKSTFNAAAIFEDDKVNLLYRAQGEDNTSVIGLAKSGSGYHIDKRLPFPVYVPREDFERKTKQGGNSGCEDPRITKIKDKLYMCYTAFNGETPPRVAFTSIKVEDFNKNIFNWDKPKLISPPGVDDKDAALLGEQMDGRYIFFHRINNDIWIDFIDDLTFSKKKYLDGNILFKPRPDKWDNLKVGIGPPPIKTEKGFLVIYHGVSNPGNIYKTGAALLSLDDPAKVLARTDYPILEPEMTYEKNGIVPNVVFPCGAVVLGDNVLVYYGGADRVVGVATMSLSKLLTSL